MSVYSRLLSVLMVLYIHLYILSLFVFKKNLKMIFLPLTIYTKHTLQGLVIANKASSDAVAINISIFLYLSVFFSIKRTSFDCMYN